MGKHVRPRHEQTVLRPRLEVKARAAGPRPDCDMRNRGVMVGVNLLESIAPDPGLRHSKSRPSVILADFQKRKTRAEGLSHPLKPALKDAAEKAAAADHRSLTPYRLKKWGPTCGQTLTRPIRRPALSIVIRVKCRTQRASGRISREVMRRVGPER
jgi:hypothetical protein